MVTADKVIVEFEARLANYNRELQNSTALFQKSTASQEKSIQRLENEIRSSSNGISTTLKGLAGAFAAGFSLRQISGILDGYTRLQNSLRVSGLEGERLASVQGRLLELSSEYGVNINSLADLYGKSSQAASELGATEEQLLQITEASSQALRITGTSAVQAQGALLGLTQALSSGVVRAEEFNQINEGGLRPLLQAAANTDAFGGSVARLRAAVVDGQLTSEQFYRAILNGSEQLEGQSSKAVLTLAGAYEGLSSAITVYLGAADQSNGVSVALASAIEALAENLDIIIPALAVISATMAGRFVFGALAGSNALRAVSAHAAIATTSLAGTTLAARSAGAALLTAFGGPVGLAITAITVGIGVLVTQTETAEASIAELNSETDRLKNEADELERQLREAGVSMDNLADSSDDAVDGLNATSRAAQNTQDKLEGLRNAAAVTAVELASLAFTEASTGVARARERLALRAGATRSGATFGIGATNSFQAEGSDEQRQLDAALARQAQARRVRDARIEALRNGVDVSSSATPSTPTTSAAPTSNRAAPRGSSPRTDRVDRGPSQEDIADRFNSELRSLASQAISAQLQTTQSAEERAELQGRLVELARIETQESIRNNQDYSAAQKERLENQLETLVFEQQAGIELERSAQLAREFQQVEEERFRLTQDALRDELSLTDNRIDRRNILFDLLDAELEQVRLANEAVIASQDATDAQKEIARLRIEALESERNARTSGILQDTASPFEQRRADLERSASNINDQFEEIGLSAIDTLNDGLVDAITNSENLGEVFKNVADGIIRDLLRIAAQQALLAVLRAIGVDISVPAAGNRASGGPVSAGRLFNVNEGASGGRVEGFMPQSSGTIIPLGQMDNIRARNSGTTVIQNFTLDARGGITTPELLEHVNNTAKNEARTAGTTAYQQAINDAPAAVNSRNRYG